MPVRVAGAVRLAERVPPRDEGDRLLVVHRHPAERLPNVPPGGNRIRVAVGPLGIHVDQAHLDGAERVRELPVAAVALVAEPLGLGPPVDVLLRLPDVLAPAGETERLEPHRFQGTVAREDHQVGPRDLPAVLLLDRPQQAARLVEVRVVGPGVEGREALRTRGAAAAAVVDAVGAGAVPRHPDEQRPVVAVVGRPPVLRRGHHHLDVLLHGIEVERLELLGVVERLTHGIGERRVLVEHLQVQLIRPPTQVRRGAGRCLPVAHHRALARARRLVLSRIVHVLQPFPFVPVAFLPADRSRQPGQYPQ